MSDDLDELFDATGDANDFDPHFEAALGHRVEMRDEIIEALTAQNRRLREALEGAESWLDRWATHVGNCAGVGFCTCGLSLVRYETSATLKGEQK